MHVVEAYEDLVVVAIVAKKIDRYCKKVRFFCYILFNVLDISDLKTTNTKIGGETMIKTALRTIRMAMIIFRILFCIAVNCVVFTTGL